MSILKEIRIYDDSLILKSNKLGPFKTKPKDVLKTFKAVGIQEIYVLFMFNDGFSLHGITTHKNVSEEYFLCDVETLSDFNEIYDKESYKEIVLENEMFPVDSETGNDIWDVYGNLICGDDVFDEDDDNEF